MECIVESGHYECAADQKAQLVGCEASELALSTCVNSQGTGGTGGSAGTGGSGGIGGTGGVGGTGGSAGEAGSAGTGPCDPLEGSCVGCGTESCGDGEVCCWSDPTPTCAVSCSGAVESSCDGAEDCSSGSCCVTFLTEPDGSVKSGTAECGSDCPLSNGSTGSGSSIRSVACRTGADCAGIAGQFGVPYSECCKATNFDVGGCVSQTFASVITTSGGSCS